MSPVIPGTSRGDQTSTSWDYVDNMLSSSLLLSLNEQRLSGLFCDVIICVDGREFQCHKNVLSAFSPYFRAMFSSAMKEAEMDKINIFDIDADMFQLLVEFAYTGHVTITEDNVKSLLATANFFEALSVRDACCKYIGQHLNETNCISIFSISDQHFCVNLRQKVKRFILTNFERVYPQPEFVTLGQDELIELLSDDQLHVTYEKDVFLALTTWLEHSKAERKEQFEKIVEHVRFPLMSPSYLLTEVESYCTELKSARCRELIEEAKVYHLLPDKRKGMENSVPRAKPRLSSCSFYPRPETIGGTVKLHLNNISKLTNESRESPLFELRNLFWSLKTKLRGNSDDKSLAAYIQFKTKDNTHGPVTCNARVRIEIKSRKMNANYNKSYTHIHRAGKSTGWSDFISYDELMNSFRGYYDEAKDSICFLVNIQADQPQYGDRDNDDSSTHSHASNSETNSMPYNPLHAYGFQNLPNLQGHGGHGGHSGHGGHQHGGHGNR